jgi:hypothetical protein
MCTKFKYTNEGGDIKTLLLLPIEYLRAYSV